MFKSVGYKVACYLHHLLTVEPHRHRCRYIKLESNIVACGILLKEHNIFAQEDGKVVLLYVYACMTLLLLAEVEQLGYQSAQLRTVAVDAKNLVVHVVGKSR